MNIEYLVKEIRKTCDCLEQHSSIKH